jgi:hypothetical protein
MIKTNRIAGSVSRLAAALALATPQAALALDTGFAPPTAVLTQEDFSDPAAVSQRWQVTSGMWSAGSGTFNSTTAAENSIATIYRYEVISPFEPPAAEMNLSQFTYDARLRNPSTSANDWVGVVYHLQNASNYYEVVFSPGGAAQARRVANGVATTLVATTYAGGGPNVWFDVAVVRDAAAGTTTIEVNGLAVISDLAQTEYAGGLLGLITHGTTGRFDKVRISTPFLDQPFQETFSEGLTQDWIPTGQWSVANGTYNNAAVEHTNTTLLPIEVGPRPNTTLSYTLRARMLNPYGASGNRVGIVFHWTSPQDYLEAVFLPTGVAQVNRIVAGRRVTLAQTVCACRRNVWFDVTFALDGLAEISVSVDGTVLFPRVFTDPSISGAFGLITHWAPGRFDDVWYEHGAFSPLSQTFAEALPASWVRSGVWNTTGGMLNSTAVGSTDVVATDCMCWDTDFRYSARLLNQFGASGNRVGLVYNYQTRGLYAGDYYEVEFTPTGVARLNKIIQGARYPVATGTHNVPSNVWFDVDVIRSGGSTTVLVNGATIFDDVAQAQLGAGDVGVATHWARGRFDDLSVEEFVVR